LNDGRHTGIEHGFSAVLLDPQVKMIEIKLSQGAKPGHGGVLPGAKVTAEIAATRGVRAGEDCVSPARHAEFSTPVELLAFVERLRELSGGKPTGFKPCIDHPWEWFAICRYVSRPPVSLAPTPAPRDSVARVLQAMSLERVGTPARRPRSRC
jgi:glutamate synthase domain-containing protein 2